MKSTLNNTELSKFVVAAKEMAELKVDVSPGCTKKFTGALNIMFAYKTDLTNKDRTRVNRVLIALLNEPEAALYSLYRR